jgi:hypothetical protein
MVTGRTYSVDHQTVNSVHGTLLTVCVHVYKDGSSQSFSGKCWLGSAGSQLKQEAREAATPALGRSRVEMVPAQEMLQDPHLYQA